MMNAVVSSNSEVDPFAEVEDECAAVKNLAKERSEILAVSMWETVDGCFYLPVCRELPEDTLLQEVAYERGEETLMLLHGEKRGIVGSWNQWTSGKCAGNSFIPGGDIWLARRFAFSRDKGQYERCKWNHRSCY